MTILEQKPLTLTVPLREEPPGVLRVGNTRVLLELAAKRTCSVNLADTERNDGQAFKRQQFSAAKSEMAYHNHFVLNSLGGNPADHT
jgi:hypothetical protein